MRIEIKEPLWPRLASLFCNAAFVGLGTLSLVEWRRFDDPFGRVLGGIMVVFCGFGALHDLRRLFESRVRLRIDERGIFDSGMGVGLIPWADLRHATLDPDFQHYGLRLEVADLGDYLKKASPRSWLRRRVKRGPETSLYLNLAGTSLLPKTVLSVIRARIPARELVA